MCRLHFGSFLCGAFVVGTILSGCHQSVEHATTKFVLSATPNNAAEFRSLFATEPTCHGFTLSESGSIRLHYYGAADAARTKFGGYVVYPQVSTELDFFGDTPEQAISHACAILKTQGGKAE
jgi:hypothetical protein